MLSLKPLLRPFGSGFHWGSFLWIFINRYVKRCTKIVDGCNANGRGGTATPRSEQRWAGFSKYGIGKPMDEWMRNIIGFNPASRWVAGWRGGGGRRGGMWTVTDGVLASISYRLVNDICGKISAPCSALGASSAWVAILCSDEQLSATL